MEEKIRAILAGILEIDASEIHDDFGPDNCQNWDSLGNLRIITSLEQSFQIKFSWPEISSITNFAAIRDLLNRRVKNEL
ncbi:MAG: acyl carrier protein [Chrysiogenales bacterium]